MSTLHWNDGAPGQVTASVCVCVCSNAPRLCSSCVLFQIISFCLILWATQWQKTQFLLFAVLQLFSYTDIVMCCRWLSCTESSIVESLYHETIVIVGNILLLYSELFCDIHSHFLCFKMQWYIHWIMDFRWKDQF